MASTATASATYKTQRGGLVSQPVSACPIYCDKATLLTGYSGSRRDFQLCGVCLCTCDSSDAARSAIGTHWCGARLILFGRTIGTAGQNRVCNLSDRISNHCAACASRQGGLVGRRDSGTCTTTWYVFPSTPNLSLRKELTRDVIRLPFLLRFCRRILNRHDLQDCAQVRSQEPAHLPLHLLDDRFRLNHVHQGFWHCAQDDFCG